MKIPTIFLFLLFFPSFLWAKVSRDITKPPPPQIHSRLYLQACEEHLGEKTHLVLWDPDTGEAREFWLWEFPCPGPRKLDINRPGPVRPGNP